MWTQAKLDEGIACFNSGRFFAAHEALEDVWRELHGPERRVMQGLIQLAVALHHYSTGNLDGARSLLARAAVKLAEAPDDFFGLSIPPLRQAVDRWQQALQERRAVPPLPRFELRQRC